MNRQERLEALGLDEISMSGSKVSLVDANSSVNGAKVFTLDGKEIEGEAKKVAVEIFNAILDQIVTSNNSVNFSGRWSDILDAIRLNSWVLLVEPGDVTLKYSKKGKDSFSAWSLDGSMALDLTLSFKVEGIKAASSEPDFELAL